MGKPGVQQSMGSQRVGHDAATEQQQQQQKRVHLYKFSCEPDDFTSVSLTTSSAVVSLERDSTLVLVHKVIVGIGHDVGLQPMAAH